MPTVSENFTKTANEIQQGTHPSPPINPITPLLEALEKELTELVDGFDLKMRSLRRAGEKAFGTSSTVTDESPKAPVEALAKQETPIASQDPQYSILPISNEQAELQTDESALIGKSKENIMAAFERAGLNAEIRAENSHDEL